MSQRRRIIPEVVQTSNMDCGPAALKCLLEGHYINASYGRLREACQTDVDGTSIDTMEAIANQLGLDAEQIMIPLDHLLLKEADALPALVVVRHPNGLTHFVVAWRTHANAIVQVMDPATGRRWPSFQTFLETVFTHSFPVPAAGWREYAGSHDFLRPLSRRLADLAISSRDTLIQTALSDESWHSLATLDAAIRITAALNRAGAIKKGSEAHNLIHKLINQTTENLKKPEASAADLPIPPTYWSVQPTEPDEDGEAQLLLRGAVLVRIRGRSSHKAESAEAPPLSPELRAALSEKPVHPLRELWHFLRQDGLLNAATILPVMFLAAAGIVLEAVILRGLIELGNQLGLWQQRLGAISTILIFFLLMLWLEFRLAHSAFQLGRQLETRLRAAFLAKIPRLRDQYFHSRPTSDMAQRSHTVHQLRLLPSLAFDLIKISATIAFTGFGIIWLSPGSWPIALLAAASAIGIPLLLQPYLAERDMRLRTHLGALSRFFLDSLLGLVPIRAHGAERAVRREHEQLLTEWGRAATNFYRAIVTLDGLQLFAAHFFAIWLLFDYLGRGGSTAGILLLVYWILSMPTWGERLATSVRQYPLQRNITLRLLEPLGAPEESAESKVLSQKPPPAPNTHHSALNTSSSSISFNNVTVLAAGNPILHGITADIQPGSHIAIVGESGAGKSSLVGLLLGWHRPVTGELLVDGRPLTADHLAQLRRHTAWVDPAIQLWNQSFLNNLRYGNDEAETAALDHIISQADLLNVLRKLPAGLQTDLGEGGGLVSGGEGQRVRFGRALGRHQPRLVILDEPFRGLDRQQRRDLLARARAYWRHTTLLCITHDVGETLDFERVLVIAHGRIAEDGPPAQLAADKSTLYHTLLTAEEGVRQDLWGDESWRNLHLENGRVVESQPTPQRSIKAKL